MVMLHGIMRVAMRKKWISANPCADAGHVKLPKGDSTGELNVLSVEEVYALARAAEDEQHAALCIEADDAGIEQQSHRSKHVDAPRAGEKFDAAQRLHCGEYRLVAEALIEATS